MRPIGAERYRHAQDSSWRYLFPVPSPRSQSAASAPAASSLSSLYLSAIFSPFSRHFLAIFSPFFNALSIKLDNYSDLQAGIYVMITDGSLYGHWRNVSFPSTRKKKGKMLKEREEEVGEGGEGG